MIIDLIPLIPLHLIKMNNNRHKLLYLSKTIRVVKGIMKYNRNALENLMKTKHVEAIRSFIERNPEEANKKNKDNTKTG
jgi:hypothetical protein